MSKKKSNLKIQNSEISGQYAVASWTPQQPVHQNHPVPPVPLVFNDKEFLKAQRELQLTKIKVQLVHTKQNLKNLKKQPVRLKLTGERLKSNKCWIKENKLLQKQRILGIKIQIKQMKKLLASE